MKKIFLLFFLSSFLYADFSGNYPDTSAVPKYNDFASLPNPVGAGNGTLAITLDDNVLWESDGTQWVALASPGAAVGIGTFDSGTPSAEGAHIDAGLLIMQSASATVPGLFNISTQTLAGVKTFNSAPIMSSLTASQAVVTNGSKALSSLAYTDANTASALVQRDASGNFTASTITAALTGTASGNPPNSRSISTTAPLTGGGNLSADRTFAITQATTSTNGYLSSTDWNTFNGKQGSGNYITSLTGGVTASGPGAAAATVVTNANLTGPITSVGNATSIASQTGTGTKFVVDTSPTLVTPVLGAATGTSLQLSGLTASQAVVTDGSKNLSSLGYASANTVSTLVQRDGSGNFTAGTITAALTGNASTVTTNANLTGPITSTGNATAIASQTGTGTKFVVDNTPTLITPVLGVATATSVTFPGGTALNAFIEGTYTPTIEVNGAAATNVAGYYYRVGNKVTAWGYCTASSATAGTVVVGLPVARTFSAGNAGRSQLGGMIWMEGVAPGTQTGLFGEASGSRAIGGQNITSVSGGGISWHFNYTL